MPTEEVSFEWPHDRVSSTELKVRTSTLHVSIINSGSERVKPSSVDVVVLAVAWQKSSTPTQKYETIDNVP